jgi:hypothetical protein
VHSAAIVIAVGLGLFLLVGITALYLRGWFR